MLALPSVSTYGGASGATMLWTYRGELYLTVVLKADIALTHDGRATVVPGAGIDPEDVARRSLGTVTVDRPSDLVPVVPTPEVLLVGHACAPDRSVATSVAVRLFVGGEQPIVDKTLHVYGDRPTLTAFPEPFSRMPLVYERACGGPGTDNPVGRTAQQGRPPNVVDPRDPWRPAGFGPLAGAWPPRARHRRDALPEVTAGVLKVPDDVELSYFQSAPPDQWAPDLTGAEWLVIDGMHPTFTRFQTELPGLRAMARFVGALGDVRVELSLDRVLIDMDRLVASLSWRAARPIRAGDVHALSVVAGIEGSGEEFGLDDPVSETMMLDEQELAGLAGEAALPFAPVARRSSPGTKSAGKPAPLPGPALPQLWATEETATATAPALHFPLPPKVDLGSTSTDPGVDKRSVSPAIPFRPPPDAARAPPAFQVPSVALDDEPESAGSTLVTEIPAELSSALPFGGRPSRQAAPPAPARVDAGAPLVPSLTQELDAAESEAPGPVASGRSSDAAPAVPSAAAAPSPAARPPPASPAAAAQAPPAQAPSPRDGAEEAAPEAAPDPGDASAGGPQRSLVVARLAAGEALFGLSLVGADLTGLDLRGVRLGDADLSRAKLAGVDLTGAKLGGVRLIGADLSSAILKDADLSRADLGRATLDGADVRGADLTDAVLTSCSGLGARFGGARCERASFANGKWERADFEGALLSAADLSGSRLEGASLRGANLVDARLTDAHGAGVILSEARLDGVNANGATLPDLDLSGATAPRSSWEGAELDRANLDGCALRGAAMARASLMAATARRVDLEGADLSNATAEGVDLSDANLTRANLRQGKLGSAVLSRATLHGANLQRVVANEARCDGVDLSSASLRFAKLRGVDLKGARIDGADLRDADLEGACLADVDRSKAKLAGANLKGVTG